MTCRHCNRKNANRPGGLCWGCYYTPGVRDLYPSTSKYARRGIGHGNRQSQPAAEPCPHPADSAGRIATLRARAERGESLSHPADNRAYDVEGS